MLGRRESLEFSSLSQGEEFAAASIARWSKRGAPAATPNAEKVIISKLSRCGRINRERLLKWADEWRAAAREGLMPQRMGSRAA